MVISMKHTIANCLSLAVKLYAYAEICRFTTFLKTHPGLGNGESQSSPFSTVDLETQAGNLVVRTYKKSFWAFGEIHGETYSFVHLVQV